MSEKNGFQCPMKAKFGKDKYSPDWMHYVFSVLVSLLLMFGAFSCWAAVGKFCDPGVCFQNKVQKAAWEKENNCVFQGHGSSQPVKDCSEKFRADPSFLEKQEGQLVVDGYVPKYKKDKTDSNGALHKAGDVYGQSGVTISTGVDLGQQDKAGTRKILNDYINQFGNPDGVDVDALLKKLDPYFTLKKDKAVKALDETPLKVTSDESRLLAKSFGYSTQLAVSKQFDANNTGQMVFKKLPSEAQTVIIDFAYQYGLQDTGSIRSDFWGYVYKGDWKGLSDWLFSNPDIYKGRRKDEGELLKSAIDAGKLPASGDPCKGVDSSPPSTDEETEVPVFDNPPI